MKRFHLVVFICLVLSACHSKKQVVQSETNRLEKTHRVNYIDTILYAPASQTELVLTISQLCDSILPVSSWTNKNGNAKATATVKNDTLFLTAKCDSLEIRAQIKQELISELEINSKERLEETHTGVSQFQFYTTVILAFVAGVGTGIILKKLLI